MERILGLSRDPFALSADGELYWESAERAELRRRLSDLLLSGCSVRLEGTPGSGRCALLTRIAGDLAVCGTPVALFEGEGEVSPESFLAGLAATVGAEPPASADLLTLAEHLYRRFVDVFCSTGPAVVVLPWVPAPAVAEEIEILAELRLLGRPLVAVAVLNSPYLPPKKFEPIPVPELTADDLRDCLAHRCAAVGCVDLLTPSALESCLAGEPGLTSALRRARAALRARVFAVALGTGDAPDPEAGAPVLDPAQVQEVSRLLESLSSDDL